MLEERNMHRMTSPVIVVPGITGSDLQDEYELPPEAVWTTLKRRFEDITLHPGDQRYEFREPARVVAGGPLPPVYEELIKALRDELSDDKDAPVPVLPFGYDWRMALAPTEEQWRHSSTKSSTGRACCLTIGRTTDTGSTRR